MTQNNLGMLKNLRKNDVRVYNASQNQIAEVIADLIVKGSESPVIRNKAVSILRDGGIPLHPFSVFQLDAIYNFVNRQIDYLRDIESEETLYSAERVLENRYGDCDDKTILSLSMLRSLGFPVAICYADIENAGDWQHIFGMVKVKEKYVPFDVTIINGSVGRMCRRYYRIRIMPII